MHLNACYTQPMLLLNIPTCVYCGNEAQSRDHFIPLIHHTQLGNFEVPCCTTCNSVAGDRRFETFDKKASWLLDQAIKKGRVKWETMKLTVPLVVARLHQLEVGNASAQSNVTTSSGTRRCKNCGEPIKNRSAAAKHCGAVCASRQARDKQRIRDYKRIGKI